MKLPTQAELDVWADALGLRRELMSRVFTVMRRFMGEFSREEMREISDAIDKYRRDHHVLH